MQAPHLLQAIRHKYIISHNRVFNQDWVADFRILISDKKLKDKNSVSTVKQDGKIYHRKAIPQKAEYMDCVTMGNVS